MGTLALHFNLRMYTYTQSSETKINNILMKCLKTVCQNSLNRIVKPEFKAIGKHIINLIQVEMILLKKNVLAKVFRVQLG